jgi:glutamine synthetase
MNTVQGYKSSNWETGLRRLCDEARPLHPARLALAARHRAGACPTCLITTPVSVAPRAILKRQVARARAMGFEPMMATELEFYLFENAYENLRDGGLSALKPISGYNEDYHIFQTTKEEDVMRDVRNHLYAAGIPIENSKGEADGPGGGELQILRRARYRRQPRHHQARRQGNRLVQGQVGHLHGQV